jgi:phosphoribosylformylglycinamidine synthase
MVDVALLFAAGTNCDLEMAQAFELAGARVTYLHINEAKADPTKLRRYRILGVPGGFTYGDYIAAGRVFANELRFRLRDEVTKFIEDGKLIIGVCNGFQVLVKAGILPGIDGYFSEQSVTLEFNDSHRFEDRWVYLEPAPDKCVFTRGIDRTIYLPVAHAEGKFVTKSRAVLDRILKQGLATVRYRLPPEGMVNTEGQRVKEEGRRAKGEGRGSTKHEVRSPNVRSSEFDVRRSVTAYPWNPNGSVYDIAGICDPTGRVFGLMPHPERYVRRTQHPRWTREMSSVKRQMSNGSARATDDGRRTTDDVPPDGLLMYQNAVNYAKSNL